MNRHRPTSVRALLGCVLGCLTLLAGCAGGSDDNGSGIDRYYDVGELVAVVEARQRADGTAQLALTGSVTGQASMTFTGQGVLRIAADGVAVRFTQTVTRDGGTPEETGYVVLPDAVYLRLPPGQGTTPERPWVRVDPRSTDPTARQLATQAASIADSADPTRNLARYTDATLVSDAEDDVADGRPAVRYTIVVDLGRAAALQPDPEARRQLEDQVRGGLTRITSTLWVDALHRPLRTEVKQDLPGIGVLALTGTFHGWGEPVEIAAPPAAEIATG